MLLGAAAVWDGYREDGYDTMHDIGHRIGSTHAPRGLHGVSMASAATQPPSFGQTLDSRIPDARVRDLHR